jgi:primary-amine oxidase
LSIEETVQIQKWLEAPERGLNLTQAHTAEQNENYISLIEAYYPPKADVLAYLAAPLTSERPQRFSRIIIYHGSDLRPSIKDHLVGPLPIGPHTTIRQLTEIYHRDDAPYNVREFNPDVDIKYLLSQITPPLADAMQVLKHFIVF